MPKSKINFIYQSGPEIKIKRKATRACLQQTIADHKFRLQGLNYIFMSDDDLLQINRDFLAHDYYTDIITFDLSDEPGCLEGEIYISTDRVNENAIKYNAKPEEEMTRVIAHGVLHLLGFSDKTPAEKKRMRAMEDQCLNLYREISRES